MNNVFDRFVEDGQENDDEGLLHATDALAITVNSSPSDTGEGMIGSRTSAELRTAVQELLKLGYVEESEKKDTFQRIVRNELGVNQALEPLDLKVKIDSHRGVALLVILHDQSSEAENDGWTHPLVRKQRLTLEQSLLVAILRHAFVLHEQDAGVGHSDVKIAVDDMVPQLFAYLGDSGSDSKNESRVLQLLDQLKSYGIVSEVDKNSEFTIRPLIAYLANPESLEALLRSLREQSAAPKSEGVVEDE